MRKKLFHALIVGIFDALIFFASFLFGFLVRFEFSWKAIPNEYIDNCVRYMPVGLVITVGLFILFKMYSFVWTFVSLKDTYRIVFSVIAANVVNFGVSILMGCVLPRSVYIMVFFFQLLAMITMRYSVKILKELTNNHRPHSGGVKRRSTMVIGAGATGELIAKELTLNKKSDMDVCCFIDDNINKHGRILANVKIVGGRNKIMECVEKYAVQIIVLAIPSASAQSRKKIIEICQRTGCELRIVPSVYQLLNNDIHVESIRKVEIEDLLDRDPIRVDLHEIMEYVANKVVLVTGGGGSIGSEICRQIAVARPRQLVIFDIYENNAYDIQLELSAKYPGLNLEVFIGSVRDGKKIEDLFRRIKPNLVFHAAAHKHVPLMEDSPNEAIKNNVFGTYNVALNADKFGVEKMVMISTDKAVNPTNIMGASKRLCEMVVQYFSRRSKTEFVAVRFGNVLGSNGSVVPLFKKQISEGGPVTVTHPDIIRYFMTIPEAVSLVLQAGAYAKGGEIFVLDMGEPVSIDRLARNLIKLSGFTPDVDIMVKYTGLRPGEKLFEELLMDEEGMKKTQNSQIYIGAPISMNDDKFREDLGLLREKCLSNSEDIKKIVSKIVPTYKANK